MITEVLNTQKLWLFTQDRTPQPSFVDEEGARKGPLPEKLQELMAARGK